MLACLGEVVGFDGDAVRVFNRLLHKASFLEHKLLGDAVQLVAGRQRVLLRNVADGLAGAAARAALEGVREHAGERAGHGAHDGAQQVRLQAQAVERRQRQHVRARHGFQHTAET